VEGFQTGSKLMKEYSKYLCKLSSITTFTLRAQVALRQRLKMRIGEM